MMITAAFVIILCSIINAARGGRFPVISELPGHTRLWAALAFAIVAEAYISAPMREMAGLKWGLGFLAWSWLPWGRWFDLGCSPTLPPREPSWFEKLVERLSGNDDQLSFLVRNMVSLVPATFIASPLCMGIAVLQSIAYNIGWRFFKGREIAVAEYLTGIAWGVILVVGG